MAHCRFFVFSVARYYNLSLMLLGAGSNCTHDMEAYDADQAVERSGITKFEPQQCEVCLCRCYEPLGNKTHRYLSLLPQMTDISKGRIIGGVRFVKIKDVIYISVSLHGTYRNLWKFAS